jgi:hypothetical protein
MGLFSRSTPKEKLNKKYRKLLEQSRALSTVNRKESDKLIAEAEDVLNEIKKLEENEST